MSDTPYYVPSYLDDSGSDNFKRFADTMPHVGPLRFRDCTTGYSIKKADIDWVLRFKTNSDVVLPVDPESANDRIPIGAQIGVMSFSYGRVKVAPASGVTITTQGGRAVVDAWKIGILTKTGDNTWSFAAPSRGSGGSTVPLPPKMTSAAGISLGVFVTWEAPSDDGGSAITGYSLESSTDQINWVSAGSTDAYGRNLTVNDLDPATTYFFRARAINGNGASDPSNVLSAKPAQGFNEATGGTVTEYMSGSRRFRVHTFTSDDTFTVSKNPNQFRVLAVGGGGGRGGWFTVVDGTGSKGGSGGHIDTSVPLAVQAHAVAVGVAGVNGSKDYNGVPGGTSSISTVQATGGSGIMGQPDGAPGQDGGPEGGLFSSNITGSDVAYGGQNNGGPSTRYGEGANHGEHAATGPARPGVVIVSYEIAPFNEATGGQITDVDNYLGTGQKWRVHRFTGNDTLTIKSSINPFKVLVVGGGGGGGTGYDFGPRPDPRFTDGGGGGGGGQVVFNSGASIPKGSYPVTVGGQSSQSSVWSIAAAGGASGGRRVGGNSGSGQPGGDKQLNPNHNGGGGGGGNASPGGVNEFPGGPGGNGTPVNITGADVYYGGGSGGGGSWPNGTPGAAGLGGVAGNGTPGIPNTGCGGGGGSWENNSPGGAGGSGVVIVAYQIG